MDLQQFGWNDYFETEFKPYAVAGYQAGRVFLEHKHLYQVYTIFGEIQGEISGKLRFNNSGSGDFPAVGDWVALSIRPEEKRGTIQAILPRRSLFSRKAAGQETIRQVMAANFDSVFVMTSLNRDFNQRRLERYLVLAWESGASPVVVLSKADLCADVEEKVALASSAAPGVPIHVISATQGVGLEPLYPYLGTGKTIAILGSSGVGKSTLSNALAGQKLLEVQTIREDDDRGRHTTTHRQLVLLPQGGMVIDTPGLRELSLWNGDEGLDNVFTEIEALARQCRFSDCNHQDEPGCAVKAAISEGSLEPKRYESYLKLRKEMVYMESKQNQRIRIEQKRRMKEIAVFSKNFKKGGP
ncbi:MAG TPA: ribosome small subunit-dependent GTPase A [Bacillota bacterium]|nr:ribosome small subunit-dependent GTPase A [Bacillota bacterium]